MGRFLTDAETNMLKGYLSVYLSLPFVNDLAGEPFEEMLAAARRGQYQGKRANRPEPDIIIDGRNYSIKTEKITRRNVHASEMLGGTEDIITARIALEEDYQELELQELGSAVLGFYNTNIVEKYHWHKIGILFRFQNNTEFIYFEEDANPFNPAEYTWRNTERGWGKKLNIAGYDASGRQRFRWNSGTTLLYVVHDIPVDSDVFQIEKTPLNITELEKLKKIYCEAKSYDISLDEILELISNGIR